MTGETGFERWPTRRERWRNAYHVRMARFAHRTSSFTSSPEPRSIGSYARGQQLLSGVFRFAGSVVEAPDVSIWDVEAPDAAFAEAVQGCAWLEDLAAAGGPAAGERARTWVWDWMERYGKGRGPGWTPELTARRLIQWIDHATFLLAGQDQAAERAFFRLLGQQTAYLARQSRVAYHGLPEFEVLTALIRAGLALTGSEKYAAPAIDRLKRACDLHIDATGGIATRNPQELMELLEVLNRAVGALVEAGKEPPRPVTDAVERMVPVLRALRHSDGGLARFHGGGRGAEGRLDGALAAAAVRTTPGHDLAMGYARVTAGRTSLIVDAAPPPPPADAMNAHASALAFEVTSGRRPLIVNCGSGASFGDGWRRAGRATPSHSALCVDGVSSARLGPRRLFGPGFAEPLVEGPGEVWVERSDGDDEHRLSLTHDGWVHSHGLVCHRELIVTSDGRAISGEDWLAAISEEEREIFDYAMVGAPLGGIGFSVRFHLHPDAETEIDLGDHAALITLRSGETWVLQHDGSADLSIEPSVYLERGRPKPRASRQIVLAARVSDYMGRVGWTLAKALDTPSNLRDVEMAELVPEEL